MHKIQVGGVLMIIVGAVILFFLASFIVGVIVFLLELLAAIVGIVLVLGGIAAIVIGPRWKRRPWGSDTRTQST